MIASTKCIVIIILGLSTVNIFGQSLFVKNPDVFKTQDLQKSLKAATASYVPNGGCFTPKGDLRALIIFASFDFYYSAQAVGGWPYTSEFPDWATRSPKPFYSSESEFTNSSSDNNNQSVSKFYYDMSNSSNKFRLFVDYYPSKVTINATGSTGWGDVNKKVIEKITATNPSFDWAPYDRRQNNPEYINDYSSYNPDGKPDFVIICYRYLNSWTYLPVLGMNNWCSGCNGFATLPGVSDITSNGYSFSDAGFTHVTGTTNPLWMFLHETGHSLYDAPHYNGNNGVSGNYFYVPIAGWGMMNINTFISALGWERWLLDWISDIKANNVNTDIKSITDLNSDGIYTLRDFITTGDVVRIKIPNGSFHNQYLWIENHQGKSIFDNNYYAPTFCDAIVPNSPRGIVAYIESINDDKSNNSMFFQGNGIRFLNADGNYDFTFDPAIITPQLAYCNNVAFNFHKGSENPLGGQNTGEFIRNDYAKKDKNGIITNPDGVIDYGSDSNNDNNEMNPIVVYNGNVSADYFMGKNSGFAIGQKVSISTNPTIINVPEYKSSINSMAPYFLNGISFKVLSQTQNGDIQVQIKFNDVDINQNFRWAGTKIILPDITENSNPDLNLLSNISITIDRSGTPNRHTKNSFTNSFVNPTVFECATNSYFKMQSGSKVYVINNSCLVLESNSNFEVGDNAKLIIKSGSTLQLKNGARLSVLGSGCVEIESGAYICFENGAKLFLQSKFSFLNLHNGYINGVNSSVLPSSTCVSNIETYSLEYASYGSISTFSKNMFEQNITYLFDYYTTGNNISSGSNVTSTKPSGNVIIPTGKNVVYDADGEILLDKGFEVQIGATFEAK